MNYPSSFDDLERRKLDKASIHWTGKKWTELSYEEAQEAHFRMLGELAQKTKRVEELERRYEEIHGMPFIYESAPGAGSHRPEGVVQPDHQEGTEL